MNTNNFLIQIYPMSFEVGFFFYDTSYINCTCILIQIQIPFSEVTKKYINTNTFHPGSHY